MVMENSFMNTNKQLCIIIITHVIKSIRAQMRDVNITHMSRRKGKQFTATANSRKRYTKVYRIHCTSLALLLSFE